MNSTIEFLSLAKKETSPDKATIAIYTVLCFVLIAFVCIIVSMFQADGDMSRDLYQIIVDKIPLALILSVLVMVTYCIVLYSKKSSNKRQKAYLDQLYEKSVDDTYDYAEILQLYRTVPEISHLGWTEKQLIDEIQKEGEKLKLLEKALEEFE